MTTPPLTERQHEIWTRWEKGQSIRTIAYALNLSPSTIRSHLDAATRNIHNAAKRESK